MAYLAAEAIPSESLPPLWVSVALEETSQQVPEWGYGELVSSFCDFSAEKLVAYGVRVEDDVAVRLRKLRELGASEVRLRGTRAVFRRPRISQCAPSCIRRDVQWLATISAGLAATFFGLYTNMPMLFGFEPKSVIWWSVDAGMELSPGGALPVGVEGAVVEGVVDVGAGVAWPGRHCE